MSKYKVDITGINTNELKVLKNKEMLELFLKYQNGDLKSKEELVNGNLKLVLSIIKKYNNGKQRYEKIKTVSTQETSYTDSKLKSGKIYCYKIVPYRSITYTNAGNLCKVVNGSSSNIAKCITKPGKPVIKAKKSGRRIKVKIKKVSGASGYKVYLRKGKKG